MNSRIIRGVFSVSLLSGLLACGSNAPPTGGAALQSNEAEYVRFVRPTTAARFTGLASLRIEAKLHESVTSMSLSMDGVPVDDFSHLMTRLELDTTQHPDGIHTIGLSATNASGASFSDSLQIEIANPRHRMIAAEQTRRSWGRGEEIVVNLEYTEPSLSISADFSSIDSAFAKGSVKVQELGAGKYQLRYTISSNNTNPVGPRDAKITAEGVDGLRLDSLINVNYVGAPPLPLVVGSRSALFVDQAPAIASDGNAPRVASVTVPDAVVEGAGGTMTVTWNAPADNPTDRIIVRSPRLSGAWVIPLDEPSESGTMEIPIDLASNSDSVSTDRIPLSVTAVGVRNNAAEAVEADLAVILNSTNGTAVILQWSGTADLDLEVTTPDLSTISYDHPSAQGGVLDLDSHQFCRPALVPSEAIVWKPGKEVPGHYGIEVSRADSCGQGDVNYTVTVRACGRTTRMSKIFPASATESQILPPFDVDCSHRLRGKVTYTKVGLLRQEDVPVVRAPLRILGTMDDTPPQTVTDGEGNYDIQFLAKAGVTPQIQVDAAWIRTAEVTPFLQVLHRSKDQVNQATMGVPSLVGEVNVKIDQATVAGAFNIREVLRKAYTWAGSTFNGRQMDLVIPTNARWDRRVATQDGGSYNECKNRKDPLTCEFHFEGKSTNPDENDDSVIGHEFVHQLARCFQIDDTPGGEHELDQRIAPHFAWSEGLASALGQHIVGGDGDSKFATMGNSTRGYVDLELTMMDESDTAAHPRAAYGSESPQNSMMGRVSESLVAAVLWDLVDPANGCDMAHYTPACTDQDNDAIGDGKQAVYDTLVGYLRSRNFTDRAAAGHDLVDFLDGWRCNRNRAALQQNQVYSDQPLIELLKVRQFSYDFPAVLTTCE